jgi:hypothetical protein
MAIGLGTGISIAFEGMGKGISMVILALCPLVLALSFGLWIFFRSINKHKVSKSIEEQQMALEQAKRTLFLAEAERFYDSQKTLPQIHHEIQRR